MPSALALRAPHSFPLFSSSPTRLRFKPLLLLSPLFSSPQTLTLTLALDLPGPSLRRGLKPPSPTEPPSDEVINRESFARAFDVVALRVPAGECAALECRLRGHLLNWPRLPNIARVPGDDLDPGLRKLIRDPSGDGGRRLEALAGRGTEPSDGGGGGEGGGGGGGGEVLSPVLYREKLVKEFNCRGFVNFRNLAKISRPKKKKVGSKEGVGPRERGGRNEIYVVEVVGGKNEEDDMRGLLGEEFRGGQWRGPTRLLLLDEQYANKGVEELPEAVKVAS